MVGIFDTPLQTKTDTEQLFIPANSNFPTTSATIPKNLNKVTESEIRNIGLETAKRSMEMSKKILSTVTTGDTEAFGSKLNELVGESKKLNPANMSSKPHFLKRWFSKGESMVDNLKGQYQTVEQRMDTLIVELDKMAAQRLERVIDLEQMAIDNKQNYDNLQSDIIASNALIERLQYEASTLTNLTDPFEAEQLAKVKDRITELEKSIDDYRRGMQLCQLAAPDIRMQQNHNKVIAKSVNDIKVTTIPAWRGVFSRYILSLEIKKSADMVNSVYDSTEEAFRMQADQQLANAVTVANLQQRSVVSVETLMHVQEQLMKSIDQTLAINQQGAKDRAAALPQLEQLSKQLINRYTTK
jgi:uncharacterized protein YaaN involved in tellurite resistance